MGAVLAVVGLLAMVPWVALWRIPPYVFVAPGVVLNGYTWLFIVNHRGRGSVFNVKIWFEDMDLRNAGVHDHNPVLLERSAQMFEFPEVGGNEMFATRFLWKPPTLEHNHFEMRITARDGLTLNESVLIERVEGNYQYAIALDDLGGSRSLLLCRDPGFPIQKFQPQSRTLPSCFPGVVKKTP